MDTAVPLFLRRELTPPSTRRPSAAPSVARSGAVPPHRRSGFGAPVFLRCLALHMYFAQHAGALD